MQRLGSDLLRKPRRLPNVVSRDVLTIWNRSATKTGAHAYIHTVHGQPNLFQQRFQITQIFKMRFIVQFNRVEPVFFGVPYPVQKRQLFPKISRICRKVKRH